MEINKEMLHMRELSAKPGTNVMVEGDIVVPDVKPDIREVLLADATAGVTSSEVRNGKLCVSGNVQFRFFYIPDREDCDITTICATFPFSDTMEIPDNEHMEFITHATTEHIGFNLVNSRKLSAKVIVSVQARGYEHKTIAPISVAETDHVQYKTSEYDIFMPLCEQQSDIALSDLLTVPAHMPDMDEILKTDAWAKTSECKIMNGKVMMRGILHLKTLYIAANEMQSIEQVSHEIPFSEIVEAEHVDENSHVNITFCIKELTATPRGDINGDTKIIHLDSVIGATLKASKSTHATFVDDCYSTSGTVETQVRKSTISELITQDSATFTETQKVTLPKGVKTCEILSATAKALLRETIFESNMLHMKGTLVTFLLYREHQEDGKGKIRSVVTETAFDHTKPMAETHLQADCELWTEEVTAELVSDGVVEIKTVLCTNCCIVKTTDASFVTDCQWLDDTESAAERPALIIYFTEEGDTLWNIAKRYGTTVEKIKSVNGLEDDMLLSGKKILIPKAV